MYREFSNEGASDADMKFNELAEQQEQLLDLWHRQQQAMEFLNGKSLEMATDHLEELRRHREDLPWSPLERAKDKLLHGGIKSAESDELEKEIEKLSRRVRIVTLDNQEYSANAHRYFVQHAGDLGTTSEDEFISNPAKYIKPSESAFTQTA